MSWLDASTYAMAACGGLVGLYLVLTGKPLPNRLGTSLPTTARGRRFAGGASLLFFLAIAVAAWGVDKPQRGLSLLAFAMLTLPSVILYLRSTAQPKRPPVAGRMTSSE